MQKLYVWHHSRCAQGLEKGDTTASLERRMATLTYFPGKPVLASCPIGSLPLLETAFGDNLAQVFLQLWCHSYHRVISIKAVKKLKELTPRW